MAVTFMNRSLQRVRGLGDTAMSDLVSEVLREKEFRDSLGAVAAAAAIPLPEALEQATTFVREMSATHSPPVIEWWEKLGRWMLRGFDVLIDEDSAAGLRELNRDHSLVFLISHKSYLDEWVVPPNIARLGMKTPFGLAGSNLDFFPLGTVARRTGIIHIRRVTGDLPIYKLSLRTFMAHLVRKHENLIWSIEGGRSRTGKLRPPRLGLLRYVVDAVEQLDSEDVYLVPVSVIYDQLPTHEVALMTSEARGKGKTPEDAQWFFSYLRGLARRLGRVYLDFGEPLSLRSRLEELRAEPQAGTTAVERVAVEVCHRINVATPVTANAVVCIAMLGADRALTLDEILETVRPMAEYLLARGAPTAGAANLTDRATIRRSLQDLVDSGVLLTFTAGTTVWGIAPEQHLTAAIYRNTAIHVLVNRAIVEIVLGGISEGVYPPGEPAWELALALRDLLKFDFFFERRANFAVELAHELSLMDPQRTPAIEPTREDARHYLNNAKLLVAHLVLRPFIDSYAVVAHELLEVGTPGIDDREFIARCLQIGNQWVLQRRIASAESISGEMFTTALRLARHRGLIDPPEGTNADHVEQERMEFLREVESVRARISAISARAAIREPGYTPLRPLPR
jgi:glycerol-3-phosphate O-acyltransferase